MDAIQFTKRQFRFIISISLLILPIFGIIIFSQLQSTAASTGKIIRASEKAILDPVAWKKYAPATYGIPDVIAGYRVIGILNSENDKCFPEGYKEIVLEVPEARAGTSDEMIKGFDLDAVKQEMSHYGDGKWDFALDGVFLPAPSIIETRALFVTSNDNFNRNSCYTIGGFEISTPTPDG